MQAPMQAPTQAPPPAGSRKRSRQNMIFQFEPHLRKRGNITQYAGFGAIVVDPAAEDNRATVDDDGAAFHHVP